MQFVVVYVCVHDTRDTEFPSAGLCVCTYNNIKRRINLSGLILTYSHFVIEYHDIDTHIDHS